MSLRLLLVVCQWRRSVVFESVTDRMTLLRSYLEKLRGLFVYVSVLRCLYILSRMVWLRLDIIY